VSLPYGCACFPLKSSVSDSEESDDEDGDCLGESFGEALYEDCTDASVAVRLVAILCGIAVDAIFAGVVQSM